MESAFWHELPRVMTYYEDDILQELEPAQVCTDPNPWDFDAGTIFSNGVGIGTGIHFESGVIEEVEMRWKTPELRLK